MPDTDIRYIPINAVVETVVETCNDWTLFLVRKESSGSVVMATGANVTATSGLTLLSDVYTPVLVSPGTSLYVYAPDNQAVSVIEMPLPFIKALIGMASGAKLPSC